MTLRSLSPAVARLTSFTPFTRLAAVSFLTGAMIFGTVAPLSAAEAVAEEVTLSLMADGDAEGPAPKIKWSAKPVRKNDSGRWEYDTSIPERELPASAGAEINFSLPKGFWEIHAEAQNGQHGRVIMEVNEALARMGWAVSDHGEPYPAEGEPTQWFLSAESDGPVLTGAPPIAEVSDFELEAVVMHEDRPVEVIKPRPGSVIRLKLVLAEGFQGTLEMRDGEKPRSTPFFSTDVAALAASEKPEVPLPEKPGYYDIRIVDQHRRTLLNHVISVEK